MPKGRTPTGLVSLCKNSNGGLMFRFSSGLNHILASYQRVNIQFDSKSKQITFTPVDIGATALIRLSNGMGSIGHLVNRESIVRRLAINYDFRGALPTEVVDGSIVVDVAPAMIRAGDLPDGWVKSFSLEKTA